MPSPWTANHQWWLEVYLRSQGHDATTNALRVMEAAKRHIGVRAPAARVLDARAAAGHPLRNKGRLGQAAFWAPRVRGDGKLKADRRERIKALSEMRR